MQRPSDETRVTESGESTNEGGKGKKKERDRENESKESYDELCKNRSSERCQLHKQDEIPGMGEGERF